MSTNEDTEWTEALLADQPDSLRHWFATECALLAIAREQERGGALAPAFLEAVTAKRQFLAGAIDRKKLQKVQKDLKKSMPDRDAASCFDRHAKVHAATHAAACCVEGAIADDANYASSQGWWQLLYAEECAEEILGAEQSQHKLQRARLVALVARLQTAWAEHGEAAPKALIAG
jgi:hypothetical protein